MMIDATSLMNIFASSKNHKSKKAHDNTKTNSLRFYILKEYERFDNKNAECKMR